MDVLFQWFRDFVNGCQYAWNWLISEQNIFGLGTFTPIFLICGALLIAGVIRAIIGLF